MERCEECRGFVGSSCVCELSDQIREAMKRHWALTDEELDAALAEGRIYPTSVGHRCENADAVIREEVPFTTQVLIRGEDG